MDEDQIDDLKQFITVVIAQANSGMATKEDIANMATKDDISNMATKQDIEILRSEMHDGFAGVGDAIEEINKQIDDNKKNVERRLTRLEQLVA